MRYGRAYDSLTPDQVETPEVGANVFLNADDQNRMYAKLTTGEVIPLFGGTAAGVKMWQGWLTAQGAGSPPSVIVFNNDFDGDIVWTNTGGGNYQGTLAGAFPGDNPNERTVVIAPSNYGNQSGLSSSVGYGVGRNDDDSVYISASSINNSTGARTPDEDVMYGMFTILQFPAEL